MNVRIGASNIAIGVRCVDRRSARLLRCMGILYWRGFCMIVMIFSTSSSLSSPALLCRGMSAFFRTMLAYLRPQPLMEVIANMMLVLPSMLVFITRRMCWKLVGATNDIFSYFFHSLVEVNQAILA